jgi:DNA-binding CsgD family transcriptional regulator
MHHFVGFELDVFKLLVRGLSAEQIAAQLGISVGAVLFHRHWVCYKAETQRRSGLIKYARMHQIPLD